jgi:pilus assembly protein CpaE
VPEDLNKLVRDARKAYRRGERRRGAALLDQILNQNFNHTGAWKVLYKEYGAGRSFDTFQHEFVGKYYPDRLNLLPDKSEKTAADDTEKRTWAQRLIPFRRRTLQKPESVEFEEGTDLTKSPESPVKSAPVPTSTQPPAEQLVETPVVERSRVQDSSVAQTSASTLTPPTPMPVPEVKESIVQTASPSSLPTESAVTIRVMVVDDIALTRENVIRSLQFQPSIEIVATASNGTQAIELVRATEPDVVLMDVNMPDMDGITATAGIKKVVPFTQVIILTVQDDVDYMRKAMLAGARDFLTKPPMIDELIQAVEGAAQVARTEKMKVSRAVQISKMGAQTSTVFGRIICVYSPKGGIGTTTLASNLAVALCDDETQVVLVDADLYYGDVTVFFNEHSNNSVADLAPRAEELDVDVVEDVLINHKSGVKILAAPRPEQAEEVKSRQFIILLEYLRKMFSYVIVDTSTKLSDITIGAFDVSDLLILITGQDIPTIARTHKFLELLPLLKFDPQRLVIVMNQYDKRINIQPEQVGESFHREVSLTLPKDGRFVQPSINRGVPFMLQGNAKSQAVGAGMYELVGILRQRISAMAEKPDNAK